MLLPCASPGVLSAWRWYQAWRECTAASVPSARTIFRVEEGAGVVRQIPG